MSNLPLNHHGEEMSQRDIYIDLKTAKSSAAKYAKTGQRHTRDIALARIAYLEPFYKGSL